jgi:exopolysaccharide biosynthesis protein
MLTAPGGDINLQHRDARLALGLDAAGRLLVALTRFDVLGPSLGSVPFGLTIPETALVMRALGAESAVGLDGGISAQLLLRDAAGETHRWPGLRAVPLGLSAVPVE